MFPLRTSPAIFRLSVLSRFCLAGSSTPLPPDQCFAQKAQFSSAMPTPASASPEDTIFDKIVRGDIPSSKVYEDDKVVAFKDANPVAPVHVLIIPKDRDGLDRLSSAEERHGSLLGHLMLKVPEVARLSGLSDYRVVINNGPKAGQTVFHLHIHIIGGRSLTWPPG